MLPLSLAFLSPLCTHLSIALIHCVPSEFLSSFFCFSYPVITAGCSPCASWLAVLPFAFRVLCASQSSLMFCLLLPHQMVTLPIKLTKINLFFFPVSWLFAILACMYFSVTSSVVEDGCGQPSQKHSSLWLELSLCTTPPNWQVLPTLSHDVVFIPQLCPLGPRLPQPTSSAVISTILADKSVD